jgi:hypothetical protein
VPISISCCWRTFRQASKQRVYNEREKLLEQEDPAFQLSSKLAARSVSPDVDTASIANPNSPPGSSALLCRGNLFLEFKFSGIGGTQFATDPDPPNDEAGCSGTLMRLPSERKHLEQGLFLQKCDSLIERSVPQEDKFGVQVKSVVFASCKSLRFSVEIQYCSNVILDIYRSCADIWSAKKGAKSLQ